MRCASSTPPRVQLLEEMMDNGFPLTTEPSILKEMIAPPTVLNRVVTTVTGTSGYGAEQAGRAICERHS